MAFSGNGAGRFQIRRIRNGSTAESFVVTNGSTRQVYAMPTDTHTPNWNTGNPPAYSSSTSYAVGTRIVFNGNIYEALVAGTLPAPTVGQTDANWQFDGEEGAQLTLTPEVLVDGVSINLDGTFNSTNKTTLVSVQWQGLVAGAWVDINPGSYSGFSSSAAGTVANTSLHIIRNLDDAAPFTTGTTVILDGEQMNLRAEVTYSIVGVTSNLSAMPSISVSRTVLTESSMFALIEVLDTGTLGSASQIWNSGYTADKQLQCNLYIGASEHTADVTYQWHDSNGAISTNTIASAQSRVLTVSRDNVNTSEVYFCIATHTGLEPGSTALNEFTSNSLELRDFLDPVMFVEIGTGTVDTDGAGSLLVRPFQNGAPMRGLTVSTLL